MFKAARVRAMSQPCSLVCAKIVQTLFGLGSALVSAFFNESMLEVSLLGLAPANCPTLMPFLKNWKVGIASTPQLAAESPHSSTSTFKILTSGCSSLSFLNSGAICLQGPHLAEQTTRDRINRREKEKEKNAPRARENKANAPGRMPINHDKRVGGFLSLHELIEFCIRIDDRVGHASTPGRRGHGQHA